MKAAWLPLAFLALGTLACDALPGKPREEDRYVEPAQVSDFEALYALNCSGCHGLEGRQGPATPLNDPLYLAIAPTAEIERSIRDGVEDTPMPAFARSQGGTLTDVQVAILAEGLAKHWGKPVTGPLPSYRSAQEGDATRGQASFRVFCAACHGAAGQGGERAGSVVDPSLLALTSDQGLRTTVIAGRPDLDMPAFDAYVEGRAMQEAEISDVVAWLISQRVEYPGQPYPEENPNASPQGGR